MKNKSLPGDADLMVELLYKRAHTEKELKQNGVIDPFKAAETLKSIGYRIAQVQQFTNYHNGKHKQTMFILAEAPPLGRRSLQR